jgi:hypothetical protein
MKTKTRLDSFIPLLALVTCFSISLAHAEEEADASSSLESSSSVDESSFDAGSSEGLDGSGVEGLEGSQSALGQFHLAYYAVLFGPSLKNPTQYQPTPNGTPDRTRPVMLRNFLALSYQLSPQIAVSGTAFWTMQPIAGEQLAMQDPFLMVSHSSIFHVENFNIYADLRAHLAVTPLSRENDLLFGLQTFQAYTYELMETGITLGLYSSERLNFFGKQGFGNALEVYISPNINYQLSQKVALNLLYGVQASQFYNQGALSQDGVFLQPGVNWDISSQFTFNPYLSIPTNGKVNLSSISMGMFLSWMLM